MPDPFDPIEYLDYLRRNTKFAALAVGIAVALTAAAAWALPKQYTATSTLVIEPPVANDPRAATAVTPIYLESLKTYEQFAASDTLFAKACARFHLEDCDESFQRRVLRVVKLKDTKVLQISATLPEPRTAQQLAEYLATETVALNRTLAREGDRETLSAIDAQWAAAKEELTRARTAYEAATASGAEELLEDDLRTLSDLKARAGTEAVRSRALLAEFAATGATAEIAAERARLDSLTTEWTSLDRQLAAKSAALSSARASRLRTTDALQHAETSAEAWSRRSADAALASGFRTEQLRVVDPGVTPSRPSWPNVPLLTGAAFALSTILALAFLTLRYGLERRRELQFRDDIAKLDFQAARSGHR